MKSIKNKAIAGLLAMLLVIGGMPEWLTIGIGTAHAAEAAGWNMVGTEMEANTFSTMEESLAVDNGTPYLAYTFYDPTSNAITARVRMFDGTQWIVLGDLSTTSGSADFISFAVDNGTPYLAYAAQTGKVTVVKYANTTGWTTVGTADFSPDGVGSYLVLKVDNGTPYVAYQNSTDYRLTVMKFDGAQWGTVGDANFSTGEADWLSLAVDQGVPYVAYSDAYSTSAQKGGIVLKYTGSGSIGHGWQQIGSGYFSSGEASIIKLAVEDGTPFVAYADGPYNNGFLTVKKYSSSGWIPVGRNDFSPGRVEDPSLSLVDGTPYVAYEDGTTSTYDIKVMKFTGSDWAYIDDSAFGSPGSMDMAAYQGVLYVAYADGANNAAAAVWKTSNSSIAPATADFDKNPAKQADVSVNLTLNGNVLDSISNGNTQLAAGTDYSLSGNTAIIAKSYLAQQSTGPVNLAFNFSTGLSQNLAIAVSDTSPLPAPNHLAAAPDDGRVVLNWDTVAGATYYELYQGTSSGNYGGGPAATVTGTTYTATGLTNGNTYYYAVKAAGNAETSGYSNEVSAMPQNLNLSGLALSDLSTGDSVDLSPVFSPSTTAYTSSVSNSVYSLNVMASVYDSLDSLKVNGTLTASGQPGGPLALSVGDNAIQVMVIGRDGRSTKIYTIHVTRTGSLSGSSGSSSGSESSSTGGESGSNVVNPLESILPSALSDGRTKLTATISTAGIQAQLAQKGDKSVIVVPVFGSADEVSAVMDGGAVQALADRAAVLDIQTAFGSYKLPAAQLNLDQLASQLGAGQDAAGLSLSIQIAKSGAVERQALTKAAASGKYEILATPVDFSIQVSKNGNSLNVDRFGSFVEREIPIPDGVVPQAVTTAVVLNADGTTRSVPTTIVSKAGSYFAVVNSLTNSTYALVSHSASFPDVANSWAGSIVDDLASRFIISGEPNGSFAPNYAMTRGQFAAILVKGLGLPNGIGTIKFSDVYPSDWDEGAIQTAASYHLISGFADGTFRPNAPITREQAMTIIAQAMKISGLQGSMAASDNYRLPSAYADADKASKWALSGIADCLQSGIVKGESAVRLAPQAFVTRAEAAEMLGRLLQKSGLIS